MSEKISPELAAQLQNTSARSAEIGVIVTLAPGTELAELQRRGLKIHHVYENISAVSGTISAAEVNSLADSDQVQTIEYDGTARALQ